MRNKIIWKAIFVMVFSFMGFALNNCCSLVIPPVVLTGGKTATEKQIVGSEKKIERNAWLIASAKTSKAQMESKWSKLTIEDKKAKEKIHFKLFKAMRTIEFFKSKIKKYRKYYIIGESLTGDLVKLAPLVDKKIIPPKKFIKVYTPEIKKKYTSSKNTKKINNLLVKVNSARKDLFLYLVSALDSKLTEEQKKAEINLIKKRIKYDTIKDLEPGNWYQKASGAWYQKKSIN